MFYGATSFAQDLCWEVNPITTTTAMLSGSSGSVTAGCRKCGAGEFRVDNATCSPCPVGEYAPEPTAGSTGAVACTSCADPSHVTLLRATSEGDCVEACDSGFVLSPSGDGQSTACFAGGCPSWAVDDGNGITCHVCPAGSFLSDGACVLCNPGYYQPNEGQASCNDKCAAGTSSGEGAASCTECDDEKYSLPGASDCFFVSYF
jgi:hypothetical protein